MRIAAIDIGTNSIHLVIASARAPDGFDVIDREREVVQIGSGSFKTGALAPEAIDRTIEALCRFVQLAQRHQVDRILCVATAAVREAKNGGEFLRRAREACGISPRVIPAAEEGRLIYLGVKSALELGRGPSLIIDIGGGSMQLVLGDRERCLGVTSAPLGSLRLAELGLKSDPPTDRELDRLRRQIRRAAKEVLAPVRKRAPLPVYGSSGSIHALANAASWFENKRPLEVVNRHVLTLKSLRKATRALAEMTIAERERLPGIDAKRAPIILPGALVLLHVLEEAEADGITLSDYGVREGLVTDYVARRGADISAFAEVENLRQRSALECLSRFSADLDHASHIARLSTRLFDQLQRVHGLGAEARELLRFGAMLHDVGGAIVYDGHAEHSYYIVKNAKLRGFTGDELELIANITRYHGKAKPRRRDHSFAGLGKRERRMVRWLSAILRIAEGLDRSHYQLVRDIKVRRGNRLKIEVDAKPEAQLEIWAAQQRTDLLSKLIGRPVEIGVKGSLARGRRRNGVAGKPAARASRGPRPSGRARVARRSRRLGRPTRIANGAGTTLAKSVSVAARR